MPDYMIKFDKDQLKMIVMELSSLGNRPSLIDPILKLSQIVALIFAALWGLHDYFSFKKDYQTITLRQQEVALEHQNLLNQSAELQIRAQHTNVERSSIALEYAKARKIDYKCDLKLTPISIPGSVSGGRANYDVKLRFSLKNASETKLEVSYHVVDGYIGRIDSSKGDEDFIIMEGFPPNLFNMSASGDTKWTLLRRDASVLAASRDVLAKDIYVQRQAISEFKSGGGVTGTWNPGEKTEFEYVYTVCAHPGDTIGFVINICFNKGIDDDDHHAFVITERLPEPNKDLSNKSIERS
jgi:hypothetical protein